MISYTSFEELYAQLCTATSGSFELTRSGSATTALLAIKLMMSGRTVAVVAENREKWTEIKALMTLFTPALSTGNAPVVQDTPSLVSLSPFTERSLHREGWAERQYAMYALTHLGTRGLVLTADNLILRMPPKDFFDGYEYTLSQGDEISPDLLLEELMQWGYERVSMVSNVGELARRGDILDIMPPGYEKPVRIDFFGDVVEEIRVFHPQSQRSVLSIDHVRFLPISPIKYDAKHSTAIPERIERLFQEAKITENEHFGLTRLYAQHDPRLLPGSVYLSPSNVASWLPKDTIWLLPDKFILEEAITGAQSLWAKILEAMAEADRPQPLRLALQSFEAVMAQYTETVHVHTTSLAIGIHKQGTDLAERTLQSFTDIFPLPEAQERPWHTLLAALRAWQTDKEQVLLSFSSERSRAKFLALAEQDGIVPLLRYEATAHGLFALVAPYRSGADLSWCSTLVLGEELLQPHAPKHRRVSTSAFKGLDRYDTLVQDDVLVHRDYGLAKFMGLVRMDFNGVANDFMLLHYAGDDKVYLPVDRLALVQRFKGSGDLTPPLDRLGSFAWQSSKEKVRKAIEKIAEDLVEMYAWRKTAKGYSYPPVGDLYREFEATFGFEETPDQAKAIHDVITDMGKTEPMDRLVCGDVGFGKTEVALRAAFYAASEGRQVALLCPTTILAEQHFQTFRARVSGFALNVGLLSRFVSPKKQKEILHAAASGQIDILIGTHRLISKDVVLPNLGLLILDEEQRFGVRHKEKLKQMKKNVDVLTLTATPIPRTLQLSMSGVRELSVIETAPLDRKPVATALIEREDHILRQVLEQELAREGQIFWVYNRVQGLEHSVEYVRSLVPNARVGMAHGQMPEHQLEEAMHKFWHAELDVLVCTAIIESGLDFPRANTLIVDQPQMFGLGQLYQLRGRVGRSERQAFAYFVVSNLNHLPQNARERLRIILELDYLGAGFQVAMEDLRLRGAGNILGEVQSGHMARVGLDLYLEMLEQAVRKVKDGEISIVPETELQLGIPAHIPEAYMASGQDRLRWYKRLSSAQDSASLEELALELKDRYGILPQELLTFMAVLAFKQLLCTMEALKADISQTRVRMTWPERPKHLDSQKLLVYIARSSGKARLVPPSSFEMLLDTSLPLDLALEAMRKDVQSLQLLGNTK